MCCAVSLWIRSLRMCMPMGLEGEECHPMSHKVKPISPLSFLHFYPFSAALYFVFTPQVSLSVFMFSYPMNIFVRSVCSLRVLTQSFNLMQRTVSYLLVNSYLQVPFSGRRLHHTCPCLPNLACITTEEGNSRCASPSKFQDYYL